MEKINPEDKESLFKKIQEELAREAVSEFNRFRLGILANQIKSKTYGHNLNKVSNI